MAEWAPGPVWTCAENLAGIRIDFYSPTRFGFCDVFDKRKGKGRPLQQTTMAQSRNRRHSSTLYLTTALDGWSTVRPGRFNPHAETRQPLYWRLGGPQGRSGCARKISPLATRIPPADRSSVTIPTELSLHNDVLDKAFLNSEASDV